MRNSHELIVISVGGSLIIPNGGVDTDFLKKLNTFIRTQVSQGKRFILIIGGGKTARNYRDAGKKVIGKISEEDLDWLGIHSTRLNAHLLRTIFQDIAHPRIITNYNRPLFNWKEPVAIGAGWKPGWSTDYDAVVVARDYHASTIINLSNIDYVYTADPGKDKNAKPIHKTTWSYFENIVGKTWSPGINAPFDPVATQLAKKLRLTAIVVNGKNFANLNNLINGERFRGTVITPYKIDASFYDREYFIGHKGRYRIGQQDSIVGKIIFTLVNFYRALWIKLVLNPKNCLDVGCGTGYLVSMLKKLGIDAYGIEISEYALSNVPKEIQPYVKKGDITKIPFDDNTFDLVVTFDVMEHIERSLLKKSLEETVRVSRKWIVHKIFTRENLWIRLFQRYDYSFMSIFSQKFWKHMFKSLDNVTIPRRVILSLPPFIESLFLLRKK